MDLAGSGGAPLPGGTPPAHEAIRGRPPYSGAFFLASLIFMVMAAPLLQSLHYGPLIQASSYTVVLLAGVWVIGRSRAALWIAVAAVIPAMAARWIEYCRPEWQTHGIASGLAMIPIGIIIVMLVRIVLRARRIDANVLCAAVSNYLMIAVLWAFGYRLLDALAPGSFIEAAGGGGPVTMDSFTPFYFSAVTLCTVGYGDIAPVSPVARMLAVLEAMTGAFYMTILIARLVALYSFRQRGSHIR